MGTPPMASPEPMDVTADDLMPQAPGFYWLCGGHSVRAGGSPMTGVAYGKKGVLGAHNLPNE